MYLQSPLDLLKNYNRFNQTAFQKATIVFFACLTIALKLILAIFTKLNSSVSIYHDLATTPLNQSVATSKYSWPSTMPVFDHFIPYLTSPNTTSLEDMTNAYIDFNLRQSNTRNSDGHWFTPNVTKRFEWDNHQVALSYGFLGSPAQENFTVFPFSRQGYSSTVASCNSKGSSNVMDITLDIYGNVVKAAGLYSTSCYPTYDSGIPILHRFNSQDSFQLPSLLDANDTIYRPPKPSGSVSASSSFGVSIFNHNTTHMTMGVKKTAHITFYNRRENATFPTDCSIDSRVNFTNNFKDLPYDAVLCELENVMLKYYNNNMMVNAQGEMVMLDFTLFQAFSVEGNLLEDKEHMVAYSTNSFLYGSPPGIDVSTNLSNDAIGSLLIELDPSDLNQETVDILSEVINAINTPTWWIVTVSTLVLLFLIPHASRFVVRRIPEYADNLRILLLLTIERSSVLEKARKIKNVGILLTDQSDETSDIALLSVNGYPITIADKLTSVETSLIEERTASTDEKLMHSS
ncbi:DNA-directed RNA polymerase II subunit L [Mucor velutinosus]|uniref:DNA-directed RNA polymerase II subunit L n=1 Tax=Mucor velutinosus TaxID=708070 RepID=A0AAN7HQU0_9FUNG|nr:DNA-directed RNA polymerase II subunit L [Mucor velutinosus]